MKRSAANPSGTLIGEERFVVAYADDLSPVITYRAMHIDMAERCLWDSEGRLRVLIQDGDPDAPIPLTEAEKEAAE